MKTYNNLWDQFVNFEGLHAAYLKARRGKRFEVEVMRFGTNLEQELFELLQQLQDGTYRTGEYHRFDVYEPKKREVASLPFRDRIVHHALVAELEKIYEPRFIYDSYACRVGKGTHAGADRVTEFLRRAHHIWPRTYVLKGDIKSYFASVDHRRLKSIVRRYVSCGRTLSLIDSIVDSWQREPGRGIPIGNLTSQLFANVYLHELDEFAKHQLHQKFYVRYMDDFVLLGSDKTELNAIRAKIGGYLDENLKLELNRKTSIFPEARGVDFLGYRIWRTHRLLRKSSAKRMRRKMRIFSERYADGDILTEEVQVSIASWLGHAKHASTYKLRKKIFSEYTF